MMRYTKILTTGIVLLTCAVTAQADNYSDNKATSYYVGLQWMLGETSLTKPNLIAGVRKTTTAASDNKVSGFDLSYAFNLEKSQSDSVRLGGLRGSCSVLTLAGVGYSFKKESLLGFVGAAGSYSKVFGEIDHKQNLGLGAELNTMSCPSDRIFEPV